MKRLLSALVLAGLTVVSAAQMTGVFIGDRPRTLFVGSEPFCLVFTQPVMGGRTGAAGFALTVQDNVACFTAVEPGSETQATLEVGERTLSYTLKARLDAPSAEIRVLFPGEPQETAATSPTVTPPARAGEPAATQPAPLESEPEEDVKAPKAAPLPVPQKVQATVVTPEQDPEVRRLESIIERLDRILKAQTTSEARYLPESATTPATTSTETGPAGAEEGQAPPAPASEPGAVKTSAAVESESATVPSDATDAPDDAAPPAEEATTPKEVDGVGYDPVADPLPPGVRVVTSLVPGKHSWRITYTLYNDGNYPLITDPSNVRITFNGEAVDTGALKQRTSSGYAGWVPPGYEEVGSVELPPLGGKGELRLEFDLTRLSPERERLTVTRRWKITTMPYVVPNKP